MDLLADVIVQLLVDKGRRAELDDRTIRLIDPATADPSFGVLGALGMAQHASPVGAAGHAPEAVVAGVWSAPNLYLARWTGAARWVVDYRLPAATTLDTYVRAEGRIPTHLEKNRWSGEVPDEVTEAFAKVGMSLDEPPFPPPPKPAPKPPAVKATRKKAAPSSGAAAKAPRAKAPARPRTAVVKEPPRPTTKVCPSCHMQKAFSQFVPESELCTDCR